MKINTIKLNNWNVREGRKYNNLDFNSAKKYKKEYTFKPANYRKIKLPGYIPEQLKQNEVDMVNHSRRKRQEEYLKSKIFENPSDTQRAWSIISYNVSANNRIIPPPIHIQSLQGVINSDGSFNHRNKLYNSELIKTSLSEIQKNPKYKKTILFDRNGQLINKNDTPVVQKYSAVWVKIPSQKTDRENFKNNVSNVEKLSNPNWCTRSKDNKAVAALEDGNFYVFVLKDTSDLWSSEVAMTTYNGKVMQIQGKENNNLIPLEFLPDIITFLNARNHISVKEDNTIKNIKLETGYTDDGPAAFTQLLIAQKLLDMK
ncbi:hypothetical protein IJ182_09715 [bacterium]|nr:hypothetical protein [bacterium]